MEKEHKALAICWLKVTDYMHGWAQSELGGSARVKEQRVICMQHLPGAKAALRMETVDEPTGKGVPGSSMSATWRNCLEAGLKLDADTIRNEFGITRRQLAMFMPIECPALCMTENGVLRPWTYDVNFSQQQCIVLQRILRNTFWKAVETFAHQYAQEHAGEKYAQMDMIESFCKETDTPDLYADTMRREWQRRMKRKGHTPDPSTQGEGN